jgi:hypothetical protein
MGLLGSATAVMALCPMMGTFTIGALGMAAAIGLGDGAVFKLVPEYFTNSIGSVTRLVGATGRPNVVQSQVRDSPRPPDSPVAQRPPPVALALHGNRFMGTSLRPSQQ